MPKIYTYDDVKREFEERGYELLSTEYHHDCFEKLDYICPKHRDKGIQQIGFTHLHSHKQGCYYCGRERTEASRRTSLEDYNGRELAESKGFEYVGMSKHDQKIWVQFICPKHRQYGVQEMPFNNMKRVVVGCTHCIKRNDSEEEILKDISNVNHFIQFLEPCKGRTKRIKMKCLKHNVELTATPQEILYGRGCPNCSKTISLSENIIQNILEANNIAYIKQFCFTDCRDKAPLPFDFYLPEYNICIEYDGEQHYRPVNFGGIDDERAKENFILTQQHDEIKNAYCKNNNIDLIRIPYWEKKNIKECLSNSLANFNINII